MHFKHIIIGAGASGLMCASSLNDVCILEMNPTPAAKVKVSGGGKCNITNKNISASDYKGDQSFISRTLQNYTNKELLNDLHKANLKPIIKKDAQYFCPKSSTELIEYLLQINTHTKIKYNTQVLRVTHANSKFHITTNKGKYSANKLIVASGGLSYPQVGCSDVAYTIAESFGHTISRTSPALVGLTVQKDEFWMKNLSGISLKVNIKVKHKNFNFDLLFTHKGISGPSILNTSLFWDKGQIEIDFIPNTTLANILKPSNKNISTILKLPKRFVLEFLNSIGIKDKPINSLNEQEKQLLSCIKSYSMAPAGTFGYKKAEVTKGGINTDEIDAHMQSKLQKNLYFIGECLDVTGRLGGFNIQWAFSSAKSINPSF